MSSNSSFYSASGTSQTLERSVADAAADAEKLAINAEDAQFTLSDGTTVGFSALHHKNKSITAQTASETAKTGSEAARNTAETHRDDAQKLSLNAEDAGFTLADGSTTGFSALHYNAKALASKTAAATSATNAATSETNSAASEAAAASSQTSATASAATSTTNANATAADVVTTNTDVVTTTADKATVATDKAIVAADKALVNTDKVASAASAAAALVSQNAAAGSAISTAADAVQTAADRVQTGSDVISTAASAAAALVSQNGAAASATGAAASQVSAAASASAAANSFDDFDDKYLGSKALAADANPTVDNDGNALVTGALYFNQSANEMRVYDGASWIAASSAGGASLLEYKYTATANQTTFTGSDDASNTLSYTVANLIVILNGIILENGGDYTATNGSSVVLTSGAAVNDELNIIAFKSFTTADMVSATNGGAFSGNVDFGAGVDVTGNATFADNGKAIFGAGSDLQIYHDGSASRIDDAGTGDLILRSSSIQLQKYTGETMAGFVADGAVTLRYDNVSKLATTATGVDVTGVVGGDTLNISGTGSGDIGIFKTTANSGTGLYINSQTANQIDLVGYDGSAASAVNIRSGGATGSGLILTAFNDVGIGRSDPQNIVGNHGGGLVVRSDAGRAATTTLFAVQSSGSYNMLEHLHNGQFKLRNDSNTQTLLVDTSGNLTATGNVTAYSDERLKSDITTIDSALDKVTAMRGVTFTKDGEAGSGVIAQELEKIAPELVMQGEEYKSVAYGNLVGYLIEAVKELSAKVEALENGSTD